MDSYLCVIICVLCNDHASVMYCMSHNGSFRFADLKNWNDGTEVSSENKRRRR